MEEWEGTVRFGELQEGLGGEKIKVSARRPGDAGRWTRKRSMPLEDILRCTLFKKGLTATMELRQYFQAVEQMERRVSKQDYLKQRRHLNPAVFKLLHEKYLGHFYRGKEPKKRRGYVVPAIDGSRVEIPDSAENRRKYGESENKYGKAAARANFSAAYDVYNRFIVDIGIHHFTSSEIEEARAHIPAVRKIIGEQPVLIIFDRNYPPLEFMNYMEKTGIKYLIRLHSTNYKAERAEMGSADAEAALIHTKARLGHLKKGKPERKRELERERSTPARIINMRFANGEEGALITNLGEEQRAAEIKELYRKRRTLVRGYWNRNTIR